MDEILRRLLSEPPAPGPMNDLDAWWARHRAAASGLQRPIHRAMAGGFAADRPAYAFASGYREALAALVPGLGPDAKVALCATEQGGAHPRAIATRLEPEGSGWRMSGQKQWTTLGPHADAFLVIASEGVDGQGKNRLVAVLVPREREGMRLELMAQTPFVPEIPHARLYMDAVRVEPGDRLPGDGYERWLKPFRTIEDCHVHAAILAWVLRVARLASWPDERIEDMMVLLAAASSLGDADPTSPAVHITLAGILRQAGALLGRCEPHWAMVDEITRAMWTRDRALLGVAGKARSQRREVAWARIR